MAKLKTKSVPLSMAQVLEVWRLVMGYTEGDGKKAIPVAVKKTCKRIRRSIEALDCIDAKKKGQIRIMAAFCEECEADFPTKEGKDETKCPACGGSGSPLPEIWVPFKKKDLSWLWDQFKEEIPKAAIAREDAIEEFAEAFGYTEDFENLTADTEPDDDDEEDDEEDDDDEEEDDAEDNADKGEEEAG